MSLSQPCHDGKTVKEGARKLKAHGRHLSRCERATVMNILCHYLLIPQEA